MRKLLLVLTFLGFASPALAQNPTCPTRPVGDNSNACASTAFVRQNSSSTRWISPNCQGTNDNAVIQASLDSIPTTGTNVGGVIYIPPGMKCAWDQTTTAFVIPTYNVTILGYSNKDENNTLPSQLVFIGTGTGDGINAKDKRGFVIQGMEISYTSAAYTGNLINLGPTTPGSTVTAYPAINNSWVGTSTNRTGTATLVNATGTVDLDINNVYFWHGFPAIKGQGLLGQNVRTTLRRVTFVQSDAIPINGCGESWILDGVTFEPLSNGTAGAFTNTEALYCKAMSLRGVWAGDVSVAGGTWFNGTWQGLSVSASQIAGDLTAATQGFNLVGSSGVSFSGGNRFELLNTAINCGVGTANTGVMVGGGNTFVSVTSKLSNTANCNFSAMAGEGNFPSTSLATSGQIPIGQSSADYANKTVSGALTNTAAGVFSVNVGAGATVTGLLPNANIANPATTVNGQTCTLGSTCTVTAASSSVAIGTTTITSGTTTRVLYDNAGVLGEYTTTQLTGQIATATAALSGAIPPWPNNTTSFFRGDGTYASVAASGLSGLGTGVATALGTNVGTAGAFVVNGGVLGTPSSGTATNIIGLPVGGVSFTTTARLLGRATAGAGVGEELSIGAGLNVSGTTLSVASLTGAVTSVGAATSLGSFTSANLSGALTDETGSGVAVFGTSPTLSTVDARGVWTTGTSWTLPALTLGGTVSGGGNQINNVIIGTSTPLAGTFTTVTSNTSVSSPIHTASAGLTFQSNGSTFAGSISTGQLWYLGGTSLTPAAGTTLTVSQNTGGTPATSTIGNLLFQGIAADSVIGTAVIDSFGAQGVIASRYAGGTQASKTALLGGGVTSFSFSGQGWDTAAYATGAGIDFVSSASTWSASNHGMGMRVRTVVDGATTLTERLRIQQGLSIGDTTDPGIGGLRATGATIQFTALASDVATTDNTVCVSSTGTLLKGSGTLGICLGTSSARFKHDIVSMGAGLAEIIKLSPKNFFYNTGYGDDGKRLQYGLIAEEVVKVLPGVTSPDKNGKVQSVDMLALVPVLVNAVKQLKADNDNLRMDVLALQATMTRRKAKQ